MDDLGLDTSSTAAWQLDSVLDDSQAPSVSPHRFARLRGGSVISLSGELVVPALIEAQQQKAVLKKVLARFERHALISTATRDAAHDFVDALGESPLPKIAPENGGGLLMTWTSEQGRRTLVILEDSTLCAVVRSGTDEAEYIEDEPFAGAIPQLILHAIAS